MAEAIKPFKDGVFLEGSIEKGAPTLVGSKCKKCGKIFFPKKKVCPNCLSFGEMEDIPLSRKGKLYTYTIAYVGPLIDKLPYAFGFIDLPEGVRIFSLLTENNPEKLRVGMEMEVVAEKIKKVTDGSEAIVYMFKPVES